MLGLQRSSESPMIRLILISWHLLTLCGSRASNEVLNRAASDLNSIDINNHSPLVMPSSIQTGLPLGEQSSVVRDQSTLKTSSNLFQTSLKDSNVLSSHFSLPALQLPQQEQQTSSPAVTTTTAATVAAEAATVAASTSSNSISHNLYQYSQEPSPSFSYALPPKTPSSKANIFPNSELLRKLSQSSSSNGLSRPQSLQGQPEGRTPTSALLPLSSAEVSVSAVSASSPPSSETQEGHSNPYVRDKRSASPNHHSSDSAIYLNTPLSRTGRDRFKHSWRRRKSFYGPPMEVSNPSSASSRVLKQSSLSEFESHSDPNPRNHHHNRREHQQNSNALFPRSSDTNNKNNNNFDDDNSSNNMNNNNNNNTPLSQPRVSQSSYRSHRVVSPESLDNRNLWKPPGSQTDLSMPTGLQEGPVVAASMSESANLANNSPVEAFAAVGQDLARNLMMRTPRSGRRYEVPQIECPRTSDRMELFACPTPDFRGRYRCIDDRVLCNGFFDCPGHEDENPDQCLFYKTTKAHLDILAEALLRWARGR
ncbi:putative uncharacterized protein DDB_G0277255 [Tigriopus californicus]|uniref:putative uncharacterized protein DDB_G0277255 n=1 Tax=Tigriopus californicus TaxID=6832 RepID=UPI0027DA60E0|nr:putative uncharacterized protein DDB_G0277255 [Tigriopus californicus]